MSKINAEIETKPFFPRHMDLDSFAESRLGHSLINSPLAYHLIGLYVSHHVGLLKEPTNTNLLKSLNELGSLADRFIPKIEDKEIETRMIGALKSKFEAAEETGQDTNLTRKVKRTLGLLGEKYLTTLLLDFGAIRFGLAKLNQRYLNADETPLGFLGVQINSKCNLSPRCPGCFAEEDAGELNYQSLDRIVDESVHLTSRFTIILGGEPLLRKGDLLKLFSKYNKIPFMVFTNGTLLDKDYAKKTAELGTVFHLINTPGLESTTNEHRGENGWNGITSAAGNLRDFGAPVGFISTVYPFNFEELSSSEFVQQMIDQEMLLGIYFPYKAPVGKPPIKDLTLTPKMEVEFSQRLADVSAKQPIFLIDTNKKEQEVGGCLAAKGSFVYVQSDGRVSLCPRIPQKADLNIHNRPLKDILLNPCFVEARRLGRGQPCLAETNTLSSLQKLVI